MKLSALGLALLLAAPASAIMPGRGDKAEGRRFGLDKLAHQGPRVFAGESDAPVRAYNHSRRGLGPAALSAGRAAPSSAHQAADAFLAEKGAELGLDPAGLVFERESDAGAHRHAMYRQTYKGLPVEFAKVKIHFDSSWGVTGIDSDFDSSIDLDPAPRLAAGQARAAALADAGAGARAVEEKLVVLQDPAKRRAARLTWRVRVAAGYARWVYYIDARDGGVAFRYDEMRRLGPCAFDGTVKGWVYKLDPQITPLSLEDFEHERVFVGDGTQWSETQLDTVGSGLNRGAGYYCAQAIGKIFTQLQGPYVNTASFVGPSAHYDNGQGVWQTIATPVSSPHPYSDNTVHTSTIDLSGGIAPGAVKFLPLFSRLEVGSVSGGEFGEGSAVTDPDAVEVMDPFGNIAGAYVGTFGQFKGAAIPGQVMHIRLKSNEAGNRTGYDVSVSSYLTLNSQYTIGTNNDVEWYPATTTALGLRSEISVFYHLNKMHDFLAQIAGAAGAAKYLAHNANAMVWAGPNLVNAQYEPFTDNLYFGDVTSVSPSDAFTDDATVPRHEYTHFFVEKIYSPQNFGQAGAISEGIADYFSASSFQWSAGLDVSGIGRYLLQSFGQTGSLRELDCPAKIACKVLDDTTWQGEIHEDSIFLSQALWDIRRDRISLQGVNNGQKCVDGLVYQTLLSFPESFQEFLAAMLRVDQSGAIAACGGAGATQATIVSRFANHGVILPSGTNDPYDVTVGLNIRHNDGFETSVNVGTVTRVSGTIFPAGDLDFFSFGAGKGRIKLHLALPEDTGGFHKGYFLTLFDSQHHAVATAHPPYDGIETDADLCKEADCTTSAAVVDLDYYAATGGLYFVQIAGGPTVSGDSNSGVHSTTPWTLTLSYERPAALTAAIVTATFDQDVISYDVAVTSWPHQQDWNYYQARLLDHNFQPIPGATTDGGTYLAAVSNTNALGKISGRVRIQNGFNDRFPSIGTVYLEVFGTNSFFTITGSTASLGISNAINLTTNQTEVKAWNNVFDPTRGQKTTIRYDVKSAGHLRVRLYTVAGKFISTLYDADVPAGKGTMDWDGRNFIGSTVASGVYLLRIQGPGIDKTSKVAVVK